MTLVGKEQEQPDPIPYRQFNRGYVAGIANEVPQSEIADIVRILSTLPVDEWLSDPTREYACGLLAGWLPSLAPDIVTQLRALVPDQQS